jgi:hypothetical protein
VRVNNHQIGFISTHRNIGHSPSITPPLRLTSIRFLTSGIRARTHFLHKNTPIRLVNCENRLIGTVRLHRLVSCSVDE